MTKRPIDLRSDTVTHPTEAMRTAMARAEVGDDVYGEDPTVRALEETVAELLGKEAALFVPTGTMGNQIALALATRPGDEVIVADATHCENYEAGAAAALSGLQFQHAGPATELSPQTIRQAVRPDHPSFPRSRLLVLENSHNAAGGTVMSAGRMRDLVDAARHAGLAAHLDGARLWHAAVALDEDPGALAEPFDTVSVCFSKGLGAPVGSALAASRSGIAHARRIRKRLGGGMRQSGVLAAAALHALEHHRERLGEDHARALGFATALSCSPEVILDLARVQTNIVRFQLRRPFADALVRDAREHGLLLQATAPDALRAVTHLDVSAEDVARAADIVRQRLDALARTAAP